MEKAPSDNHAQGYGCHLRLWKGAVTTIALRMVVASVSCSVVPFNACRMLYDCVSLRIVETFSPHLLITITMVWSIHFRHRVLLMQVAMDGNGWQCGMDDIG